MTLEESVQHVVMEAIQEVGEGIPCGSPEGSGEGPFLGYRHLGTDLALQGKVRPLIYVSSKSEPCSLKGCGLFLPWKEPLGRNYLTKN